MPTKTDKVNFYDPATGLLSTKHVMVEYQDLPVKDETIVIVKAGKDGPERIVIVQVGPTPGEAFAVYSKNKAFHDLGIAEWERDAKIALDKWAARTNHAVTRILPEHGRPLNLKLEYV